MKKISLSPQVLIKISAVTISTIIISSAVIYIVYQNKQLQQRLYQVMQTKNSQSDPQLQQEIDQLIKQIGSVIELPTDENPTIATILDVETLKANPFFTRAQNNDKIIVYRNAGKAFLYRPTTKKVIEIGSFSPDSLPQGTTQFGPEESGTFLLSPTAEPIDETIPEGTSSSRRPRTNN
jgi:hypothetical protein